MPGTRKLGKTTDQRKAMLRQQVTLYFFPQQRGNPISHHTIQDTSGLLRIDQIHINFTWMF